METYRNISKHRAEELKRHFPGWSSTADLGIWISVPSWNGVESWVFGGWVPDKDSEAMSCPKHFEFLNPIHSKSKDSSEGRMMRRKIVSLGILPSEHQPKPQPLPVTEPTPCPHEEKSPHEPRAECPKWCKLTGAGFTEYQNPSNPNLQTSSSYSLAIHWLFRYAETAMAWATCNDKFQLTRSDSPFLMQGLSAWGLEHL